MAIASAELLGLEVAHGTLPTVLLRPQPYRPLLPWWPEVAAKA